MQDKVKNQIWLFIMLLSIIAFIILAPFLLGLIFNWLNSNSSYLFMGGLLLLGIWLYLVYFYINLLITQIRKFIKFINSQNKIP